ncbi:RNA polymerase sigma factor [Archangium violaceum]|jgi:RNA polymerase sigma-70 factor, ECF subfamily|uniref:RNA polymerase sigma factor n=1 Tax=Archangium violaceum TaxID=83451 RepID=UPI00194F0009|nr:RNA polymerase sigma factor [Archangium violaceum]QRN99112.1 RNA polymerase sigma factor [Archangium violaceum]
MPLPEREGRFLLQAGLVEAEGKKRALFLKLWEQHREYLHGLCRRHLGSASDAEEAMSELAMKLWRKLPWPEALIHPKGWLRRMALNVCIDLRRGRRSGDWLVELEELENEEGGLSSCTRTPEQVLLGREMWGETREQLEALSPGLRQVAQLHFVEELSYAVIAAQLGLSQVNVRKRIERARTQLRHARLSAR